MIVATRRRRETLLRAKALIDNLTTSSQRFSILYGIWACHYVGGEIVKQRDAALEFLAEAERHNDAGRVEGRVDVEGFTVILEEGGELHADVSATGIIVGGTVKGSLSAERRIELRSTASIQGDLSAPTIRVDDGALVTGKMDIEGSRKESLARAS